MCRASGDVNLGFEFNTCQKSWSVRFPWPCSLHVLRTPQSPEVVLSHRAGWELLPYCPFHMLRDRLPEIKLHVQSIGVLTSLLSVPEILASISLSLQAHT